MTGQFPINEAGAKSSGERPSCSKATSNQRKRHFGKSTRLAAIRTLRMTAFEPVAEELLGFLPNSPNLLLDRIAAINPLAVADRRLKT